MVGPKIACITLPLALEVPFLHPFVELGRAPAVIPSLTISAWIKKLLGLPTFALELAKATTMNGSLAPSRVRPKLTIRCRLCYLTLISGKTLLSVNYQNVRIVASNQPPFLCSRIAATVLVYD